jgi:hypothetical protein
MAQVLQDFSYKYLDTAATTQVYTGPCTLHSIVIGTTAAGTIKVIDGTSGATANVDTLKASIAEGTYLFDCAMGTGIRIVAADNSIFTVTYKAS